MGTVGSGGAAAGPGPQAVAQRAAVRGRMRSFNGKRGVCLPRSSRPCLPAVLVEVVVSSGEVEAMAAQAAWTKPSSRVWILCFFEYTVLTLMFMASATASGDMPRLK